MRHVTIAMVLSGLLAVPALAQAQQRPVGMVAPQYRISQPYAKRLVRKALHKRTTHPRWTVKPTTRPISGTVSTFPIGPSSYYNAKARGPFLMHLPVLPTYTATVNIVKGKNAPRGLDRVTLTPNEVWAGGGPPPLRQ
jgi:hypothetical protein